MNPQDAVYHKNLGAAWLARGDVERALEAWTEAVRLDPATFEREAIGVPAPGVSLSRQYYLYAKLLAAAATPRRRSSTWSRPTRRASTTPEVEGTATATWSWTRATRRSNRPCHPKDQGADGRGGRPPPPFRVAVPTWREPSFTRGPVESEPPVVRGTAPVAAMMSAPLPAVR
jgi:hypothetical protein